MAKKNREEKEENWSWNRRDTNTFTIQMLTNLY